MVSALSQMPPKERKCTIAIFIIDWLTVLFCIGALIVICLRLDGKEEENDNNTNLVIIAFAFVFLAISLALYLIHLIVSCSGFCCECCHPKCCCRFCKFVFKVICLAFIVGGILCNYYFKGKKDKDGSFDSDNVKKLAGLILGIIAVVICFIGTILELFIICFINKDNGEYTQAKNPANPTNREMVEII